MYFMQVALFLAKVHRPVHFCSCLVDYIFFQKQRLKLEYPFPNGCVHVWIPFSGCLAKYTSAKSLLSYGSSQSAYTEAKIHEMQVLWWDEGPHLGYVVKLRG